MPDRALAAIMEAARAGEKTPAIQALVGNLFVAGQPIAESDFADVWAHSVSDPAFKRSRPKRDDWDQVWQGIWADTNSYLGPVRSALADAAEPDGLCLAPARCVLVTTGEVGDMSCLRVPIDRIDAWWGGEAKWKQRSGETSFFVGGLFPIPGS